MLVLMYELKKMERYLRVNLSAPGPRRMKKEFTGPRSHEGWETLVYSKLEAMEEFNYLGCISTFSSNEWVEVQRQIMAANKTCFKPWKNWSQNCSYGY